MHLPWREVAPGAGPAISTSVTTAEAATLGKLSAGRQVLEVGSAFGYSACLFGVSGADHVLAVDPHTWIPGSFETMLEHLAGYGLTDRVEIMREPSQTALPVLAGEGAQFGLVFIDGDHSYEAARHDIGWALKLLEPGGTLAVHDVGELCCCPGVGQATRELLSGGEMVDTMLVVTP